MLIRLFVMLFVATGLWCETSEAKQAAGKRLQQVAKELNLSEDQKSQITPILVEDAPKFRALRDDTTLSRGTRSRR